MFARQFASFLFISARENKLFVSIPSVSLSLLTEAWYYCTSQDEKDLMFNCLPKRY